MHVLYIIMFKYIYIHICLHGLAISNKTSHLSPRLGYNLP